jgi:4-hydroxy-2-oxoheptanedioate aldolase
MRVMDMELATNRFKAALSQGRRQIGAWCSLGSPASVEILGDAGFDWLLLDTEHAPTELDGLLAQLRAAEGGRASVVVRPAWNDAVIFKRMLDIGVQSFLVPYVQSPEEAVRAVAATRYPPRGFRGVASVHRANRYGRVRGYAQRANEEIAVALQIETKVALDRLEAIAAVDGVDALFIGPSDLAASLGHIGNNGHRDVQAAIADACARCRRVGKPIGILAPAEADARRFLGMGFSFVAVTSDVVLLRQGSDGVVQAYSSTNSQTSSG